MLVALVLAAGPVSAECGAPTAPGTPPTFEGSPPVAPDPALRPKRPECLKSLETPSAENCDRGVLSAYGAAVETWVSDLNRYVAETNAYANAVARHANATIDAAQSSRSSADAALTFAECEAAEIRGSGG